MVQRGCCDLLVDSKDKEVQLLAKKCAAQGAKAAPSSSIELAYSNARACFAHEAAPLINKRFDRYLSQLGDTATLPSSNPKYKNVRDMLSALRDLIVPRLVLDGGDAPKIVYATALTHQKLDPVFRAQLEQAKRACRLNVSESCMSDMRRKVLSLLRIEAQKLKTLHVGEGIDAFIDATVNEYDSSLNFRRSI